MPRKTAIHLVAAAMLLAPCVSLAQSAGPPNADAATINARRGGGFRVGSWDTRLVRVEGAEYSSSPTFELYFQRGITSHVVLESSAGIWQRRAEIPQPAGTPVITRSWVVPISSALKIYPITLPKVLLEPFLLAGAGFAIGFENVSTNAIGGGGNSTAAGFGYKAAAGVDVHLTHTLGVSAAWRYQSVKFGDRIGGQESYSGAGFEGGVTYRGAVKR